MPPLARIDDLAPRLKRGAFFCMNGKSEPVQDENYAADVTSYRTVRRAKYGARRYRAKRFRTGSCQSLSGQIGNRFF
ncbi:hypothetical protein BJF95_13020 [Rhizobium oryziradicis]|uniref:Uncharacterized protein n=1 Tax=Rhizobium oryziradicis TaxID=1867956 RepID=A0A1Q8ZKF3_9HYPH|nr:hypothetical protein BJF95_13020 [Rhizobium oryziradicis]